MASQAVLGHDAVDVPASMPAARTQRMLFGLPVPMALLIVCFFIPQEASIFIADQRWTISRLILLFLTPYIVFRFILILLQDVQSVCLADVILLLPGIWMFVSSYYTTDTRWLLFAGSNAMELCVPYAAARVLLREEGQITPAIRLLAGCMAVTGVLAVLDPLTGEIFLKVGLAQLTGAQAPFFYEYRQGLLRSHSVYEHPILLGCACVLGMIMAWYGGGRGRTLMLLGNFMGLFLSLSSAPFGAFFITLGLFVYERVTRPLPNRWVLLFVAFAVPAFLLFTFHESPWSVIFRFLAFSQETAWYRILQWETLLPYVDISFWVGWGDGRLFALQTGLTASIDSQWLSLAIVFGVPVSLSVALIYLGSCTVGTGQRSRRSQLSPTSRKISLALGMCMFIYVFLGATVAFWGSLYIIGSFMAGIRASLGSLSRQPSQA